MERPQTASGILLYSLIFRGQTQKGQAVYSAGAPLLDSLVVFFGAIAFVGLKKVLRELCRQTLHEDVTLYIGGDRSERYNGLKRVAFDDCLLIIFIRFFV